MGRWINRDPIGEQGGVHLYGFVQNRPIRMIDALGLTTINTESEAVDYYRSNAGGTVNAGSNLIDRIKKSDGFRDSKKTTIDAIVKQLHESVEDLCCKTSGTTTVRL